MLFPPYTACLGTVGRHHVTTAKALDTEKRMVYLANGEELEYDFLVITTGSFYKAPFKFGIDTPTEKKVCLEYIQTLNAKLKALKTNDLVVVVGGGVVGVETACEVKTDFPKLRVLIVHSGKELMDKEGTSKFHSRVDTICKRVGIETKLENKVCNLPKDSKDGVIFFDEKTVLTLNNGDAIQGASCLITCMGAPPNSKIFTQGIPRTSKGYIEVDEHFLVQGHSNIFCCGDVCNLPTPAPKLGYIAARYQAPVCAENLIHAIKGEKKMGKYSPPPVSVFGCSLGRKESVFQVGWFVIEHFLVQKARDLYTEQTWEEIGLKIPDTKYRIKNETK